MSQPYSLSGHSTYTHTVIHRHGTDRYHRHIVVRDSQQGRVAESEDAAADYTGGAMDA